MSPHAKPSLTPPSETEHRVKANRQNEKLKRNHTSHFCTLYLDEHLKGEHTSEDIVKVTQYLENREKIRRQIVLFHIMQIN